LNNLSDFHEKTSNFANSYGRAHGLFVGSGTAALAIACLQVNPSRPKILLPALACAHVLYAVLYAGCTPVFVDVLPETGLIDPKKACELLTKDPQIGGIVVVHLYGQVVDTKRLSKIANDLGVLVIEDAAQAQGATYKDGSLVGSHGDFSIFSFGHTKILDVGGGGILMTNSQKLFNMCRETASDLLIPPETSNKDLKRYRTKYYKIWREGEKDPTALLEIGDLHEEFRSSFLTSANPRCLQKVLDNVANLEKLISERKRLQQLYAKALGGLDNVSIVDPEPGWVPWRFVFQVPSSWRNDLIFILRKEKIDVSSWYPSLSLFCNAAQPGQKPLKNAHIFSSQVVNLWLTPGYAEAMVSKSCSLISNYVRRR